MANVQFFPINTPLINYFFYPAPLTQGGPNVPLAGGTLTFYADEDHSLQLPTYSDVFDPENPVVNPNPIVLGQAGDCPPFYLEDRLYFIQIQDPNGNVIATVAHYDPSQNQSNITTGTNQNIIANGQASYPITFWQESDEEGLITQQETIIAWGWEFLQDANTTTQNVIEFIPIDNEQIEGDPINEVQLTSTNIQSGESTKDFRWYLGSANYSQGQPLTFAMQLASGLTGNASASLYFEINYGQGGSAPVLYDIEDITITPERQKFVFNYDVPATMGVTLGPDNYCALRLSISVGQICVVTLTNIQGLPGEISDPIYFSEDFNDTRAKIVGNAIDIANAGLLQNYSNYMYADGFIYPYADTGTMAICPIGPPQPYRVPCDGTAYPVSGYSQSNIPYVRLFNVIGSIYGGAGALTVTSEQNNVMFSSGVGAREHSAYVAGTSGFVPTRTINGFATGVSAALTSGQTTEVDLTWIGDFAPVQTPGSAAPHSAAPPTGVIGNWFYYGSGPGTLSAATITAGSGSAQAVGRLTFGSSAATDYKTKSFGNGPFTMDTRNFLEFAVFSNNTRGTYPNFVSAIRFSVDGIVEAIYNINGSYNTLTIPFLSTNSLSQNINTFIQAVNNPFLWTVNIPAVPTLQGSVGPWFGFSSSSTDYYVYFTINGAGTDPAPAGRTNALESASPTYIPLTSADTPITIATAMAANLNNLEFNVPDQSTMLPAIPSGGSSLSQWYINL